MEFVMTRIRHEIKLVLEKLIPGQIRIIIDRKGIYPKNGLLK